MMTLSNFENFVPPHIWMRGEEYFESGAVTELEETELGEWIAQVEGTKDYEVEVSIEGKEIVYWDCDCPYDGDICKHVVAVILAIRENKSKEKRFLSAKEVKIMEKQKKMSKDTNVKDILSFVSPKQLSNFILEYASGHPECKQALIEKFLPERNTTNKTSLDYRTEIQQCFNVPYRETEDRYGRYHGPETDWNKVSCYLDGYLKKAELLCERHNFADAASIALQILQSIGENYIEQELLYHDGMAIINFCDSSGKILMNIIKHSDVSATLKKEILKEVRLIEKLSAYREYDIYDIEQLLELITLETQTKEEALSYVNQLIEERKDSWELYKLIERKVDILRALHREEEAQATIKFYLYLPEIRKQEVERYIENQQYDEAIKTLNEGIQIAQKKGELGTIKEWLEYKLSIYEQTENIPCLIDACKELFILENGDLAYYRKLKKYVAKEKWKTFLNAMMKQTKFIKYYLGGQCNEADIYAEEEDYESLLNLLSDTSHRSIEALLHYAHHLTEIYSDEILQLLHKSICKYAEENVGRNHYEYIVRILKETKKLKGGKALVQEIVEEFRVTYKRRPSMMEVLRNF
ncbi:SWIM zinc finger family protein [Bacteroides nordii]|uniref:SWIM zinc finger family protein n=1 Tax=Bacteroides nordii TaxID=291645 RepID=UPI00189F30EB|nr:SWIM zinc finger family protein [Bacteroides nordii]